MLYPTAPKTSTMNHRLLAGPLCILLLGLCACAIAPRGFDPEAAVPPRESTEWCNVLSQPADKQDLPRVLLVGDSIAAGYHGAVSGQLSGTAYVNCLSTSRGIGDRTLRDEILSQVRNHRLAVIHLNNGLHGIAYSAEAYEAGMRLLIADLRAANPNAKLVLVTSTFVLPGFPYWKSDAFNRQLVVERNAVVMKLGGELGLPVDDLNAVTRDHPEFYGGDKIHYNGNGYAALGKQVAESLRPLLPTK